MHVILWVNSVIDLQMCFFIRHEIILGYKLKQIKMFQI